MSSSIGKVKWYGGFNNNTNTENKFGFVDDVSGFDVYLHENAWNEVSKPQENQIVVYTLEMKSGKYSAKNARLFRLEETGDLELFKTLCMKPVLSQKDQFIKDEITKNLVLGFAEFSGDLLQKLVEVVGKESLCNLLAKELYWEKNLNTLIAHGMVSPLQDLPLHLLPANFLTSNPSQVADYLLSLNADEACQKARAMSFRMSEDLVCFALLAGFLKPDTQLTDSLARFIHAIDSGQSVMPDYLKQYIGTHIKPTEADDLTDDVTALLQACVLVFGKQAFCELLSKRKGWEKNLDLMAQGGFVNPLQYLSLDLLPANFITSNPSQVADYLLSLDADEASQKAQANASRMSEDLVCFALLAGFLKPDTQRGDSLARFIHAIDSGQSVMPDYLKQYIGTHIKPTEADDLTDDVTALLQACVVVFGKQALCELLAKGDGWGQTLSTLVKRGFVNPFQDLPLDLLPANFITSNPSQVADYLLSLDADEASQKAQAMASRMSEDLVCFVLLAGYIKPVNKLADSLARFILAIDSGQSVMPDYLKQYIDTHIIPAGADALSDNATALLQACVVVFGKQALCELLAKVDGWGQTLSTLVKRGFVNPFQDLPLDLLPAGFFTSNRSQVADYLLSLDAEEASQTAQAISSRMPIDLVCFALLAGFLKLDNQRGDSLARFIQAIDSGHSVMPEYLRQYIGTNIKATGADAISQNPTDLLQAFAVVFGIKPLCELLAKVDVCEPTLRTLVQRGVFIALHYLPLHLLSADFLTRNSHQVADYLLSLNKDEASQTAQAISSRMPIELVCFALLAGFLKLDNQRADSLARFIHAIYSGKSAVPKYLQQYINTHIKFTGNDSVSENSSDVLQAFAEVFGKLPLCELLAPQAYWEQNLDSLVKRGIVNPIKDLSVDLLPDNYIPNNRSKVADYLLSLDVDSARQKTKDILAILPDDMLCFALLARFIKPDTKLLASLDRFVRAIYSGGQKMPGYLKKYIDSHIKPNGGVIKDEVVGQTFCRYQFKYYLYSQDLKFVSLYNQTPSLQERADTFILGEIFSLVLAGTSLDNLSPVFLGRLWGAISSGKINIARDNALILSLFPPCPTMPSGLSCEAVHWAKQDKYLCRGRACSDPRVIPDMRKHYLDFTIYDWFFYYGIRYENNVNPSKQDFPIKLAGYFNRLHEIYDVIHCRECSSLMLPDMRYARVEHTVFENGEFVKKDMAPAYRLTVFRCPNESCIEHGQGHYINHCRGYDCYQLIDDRDSKTKCDIGLYICNGCGSCCADHEKSNPVGLCPDCGSELQLFETSQNNLGKNQPDRFVKCSNQHCGFHIPTEKLNKRFYQPTCGPVIKAY